MSKLSLNLKEENIACLNMDVILTSLKAMQNDIFRCDIVESDTLTKKMECDPLCNQFKYLIFYSDLDKLFHAKVFVRFNSNDFELFNINSTDPGHSKLEDVQYNHIVLEFQKFIGRAMAQIVQVK